jgi:PiT family inorganic phosphate transporter
MVIIFGVSIFAGLLLSLWNGANDNFKGVATLYGSKTTSYRTALLWATITTLLGSLAAIYLASELLTNFSGKGLVSDEVLEMKSFAVSVSLGAGMIVFLATRLGFPISTTHALVGALIGAGTIASPAGVNFSKLLTTFFLPLLFSPLLAALIVIIIYPTFRFFKKKIGIKRESCFCIGNEVLEMAPANISPCQFTGFIQVDCGPSFRVGTTVTCEERYTGHFLGLKAKTFLDYAHFLSAGLVSFARGLNDTPKIAAILIAGSAISTLSSITLVSVSIALGGFFFSKRIAQTMSFNITKMNDGQGFSANLVTGIIVIFASKLGVPVSTTHVSCGSLFGIGTITGQGEWKVITKIISSWIITLPVAAVASYLIFVMIR